MSLQRNIEERLGVPGSADPEVEIKLYVTNDKDSNWSKLEEDPVLRDACLSEEAKRNFVYTGLEIELRCIVNVKTGKARCTHVDGVALEEAITI